MKEGHTRSIGGLRRGWHERVGDSISFVATLPLPYAQDLYGAFRADQYVDLTASGA